MLGRVMNCIETLFVHDGQGHPIYFKTFNGHADLGKNGLEMIDKITEYLEEATDINGEFSVNRILVMDGGGNAVKILRAIKDYYYVTILDNNQINDRKLKFVTEKSRYDNGEAYLIDCKIELKDSNDGYLFETRAIQIKWDNGKSSTLVTNLSPEMFSSSNVVKSYFDRWPAKELDFKNMKNSVNIYRMVGYGKKEVENPLVIEKIALLQGQIAKLKNELKVPISKIKALESDNQSLIRRELSYRKKSRIAKGKRVFSTEKDKQEFKTIQKELAKTLKKINDIKKGEGKGFVSLKKKEDELVRIIDKKKRYYVDVELDQLMTCFKISFANICSYLLDECFAGGMKMSIHSLLESVFELHGRVEEKGDQRQILIEQNQKQPTMMRVVDAGLQIVNRKQIKTIDGKIYNFKLV